MHYLRLLPLLGVGAVVLLAQLQVKARSEQAALALTLGGGIEAAFLISRLFLPSPWLGVLNPLVQASAVGAVAYALIALAHTLHPKHPTALPVLLANNSPVTPNTPLLATFGFFSFAGVMAASAHSVLGTLSALVAIAGAIAGSVWLARQGPLARWVLERRPDLAVWTYVYQLRLVNRRTGSSSLHWSARVGLASGALVVLPAGTEQHAQTLVAAVLERCPGIVVGHSAENAARFKATPEAMRSSQRT